ncbi:MAG: ABC-2 transporter permease [Bacteroidales bacterium]|nr:ABC-2 transporter permease [Bacteroidales bacterium]MCM1416571.1 ABC-2 transporter permease [bacterium]MCM1424599.1 ABC-2 transporter permease [bacterium]
MRALQFMKIDYVLTRKQLYIIPVFFVIALGVGSEMEEKAVSLLVASMYLLFIGSIFASTPFSYCTGKSKKFLLLFPATVKDRVIGRFLYGLSFMAALGLLCGAILGVNYLMGTETPRWMLAVCLCELAVGIVIMTLQFLFFYLFGEGKDNWQYLSNIVRVVPGMVVFFGMSHAIGAVRDTAAFDMTAGLETISGRLLQAGAAAVAASLVLMAAAAAVCVKAIEKRDYA